MWAVRPPDFGGYLAGASMFARRWLSSIVFGAALPVAARAQSVRGNVFDAGGRPIAGAVVLLLDSTSQVTARGLSTERGEYRLAAARPGTYRVRALRIGFRPTASDPIVLSTGSETAQRLLLANLPLVLDTIRVVDRNICRAFTDSGAATNANAVQ